jgi:poly(ADP-ribose) glycohydrolase ARH3
VNLGGDTDTIGAMAGAAAGALHGVEGIPGEWMEALENGEKGRDYVRHLAEALWETWRQSADSRG